MPKGRKKLPTKIKKLRGTLQKCRENLAEPDMTLVAVIPEAPIWLSSMGKDIWYETSQELFNKHLLYVTSIKLLTAYCNEMALYIETEQMLRDKTRVLASYKETTYTDEDGKEQIKKEITKIQLLPYQRIAKEALNYALRLAVEFGLTPSSQSKIIAPFRNDDKFDEFFD